MNAHTAVDLRLERSELLRRGGLTLAATLLAMVVVRGVGGLVVPLGGVEPMAWPSVLGSAGVATVLGTLVYAAVTRLSDRPNRVFVALAAVGLVGSLVPLAVVAPAIPGVTTAVVGVMAVMHVVAAVVVTGGLTGVGR